VGTFPDSVSVVLSQFMVEWGRPLRIVFSHRSGWLLRARWSLGLGFRTFRAKLKQQTYRLNLITVSHCDRMQPWRSAAAQLLLCSFTQARGQLQLPRLTPHSRGQCTAWAVCLAGASRELGSPQPALTAAESVARTSSRG